MVLRRGDPASKLAFLGWLAALAGKWADILYSMYTYIIVVVQNSRVRTVVCTDVVLESGGYTL